MSRELDGRQKGQVLVIAALAMVVLVGFLALAIDGGNAYAQRRLMQNAADAGALAGARALALGENAEAAATEYAVDHNRADSAEITVDGQTVTVVARKSFPTFFAGVIGIRDLTASARAEASYSGAKSVTGLRPIAVEEKDYEFGNEYTIWDSGIITDGQRGWLDFDGGQLRDWVANGYGDEVSVDDEVEGKPGENASALQKAEDLIGETVVVCAYDQMHKEQGKWYYRISSFVAFEITDVKSTGSPKWIKGRCQPLVAVGEGGGPDHGVRVVNLTK